MSNASYAEHAIRHEKEHEGSVEDPYLWSLLRMVLGTNQYASKEEVVMKAAEVTDKMIELRKQAILGPDTRP